MAINNPEFEYFRIAIGDQDGHHLVEKTERHFRQSARKENYICNDHNEAGNSKNCKTFSIVADLNRIEHRII